MSRIVKWLRLRALLMSMDLLHWSARLPLWAGCDDRDVRSHLDYIIEFGKAERRWHEAQGGGQ